MTAIAELVAELGESVAVEPEVLAAHSTDRSGWTTDESPAAVVFAASTADVATVLRIADRWRIPVVTRGAGTGLAGGASAGDGVIVLSTERMTTIVEVSQSDRVARVQAGVITADVDAAAIGVGLRYAPDPGSVAISTIGGNIATNAGGLRCAKYGVTKDSVLGLQVVLPGGRVVETGTRTIKGVSGFDLTALLVGSEGTLAVVTEATLRLRSLPSEIHTVVALFDSATQAADAAASVQSAGEVPVVSELIDATTLSAIDAYTGNTFRSRGDALLMVQFDGGDGARAAAAVVEVLTPLAVTVTVDDGTGGGADGLIAARRDALPALEALAHQRGGRVLIEDVAVPTSKLGVMVTAIEKIAADHGLLIATLAHAGDGNLHPIIVTDEPEIPERAWRAADEIFTAALGFGGTLTGEHGVGLLKQQWLGREVGDDAAALMRGIKAVFDPNGIMNPGKALPS